MKSNQHYVLYFRNKSDKTPTERLGPYPVALAKHVAKQKRAIVTYGVWTTKSV